MAESSAGSPFRRAGVSSSSAQTPGRGCDAGFSLVEVTIAAFVLVVGLLALAQLLTITISAESIARNTALATRLGQGKLDELMKADFTSNPQIQVTAGGVNTLAANVANYFDNPAPLITRRWLVQAGPASTRILTVRVIVGDGTTTRRAVDLTTLVRRW